MGPLNQIRFDQKRDCWFGSDRFQVASSCANSRNIGTVRNASGAVIPDANVEVTAEATGLKRSTRTSSSGDS